MPQSRDGSGSVYGRGNVWWVKVYVDGKPHRESSKSTKYGDAKRLRDKLLGQKLRGQISGGRPDRVTMGELLDDFLEYAKGNVRASTEYIYRKVTERNLRPFFDTLKPQKVTTETLHEYRRGRIRRPCRGHGQPRELAWFALPSGRGKNVHRRRSSSFHTSQCRGRRMSKQAF